MGDRWIVSVGSNTVEIRGPEGVTFSAYLEPGPTAMRAIRLAHELVDAANANEEEGDEA